MFEEHFSSDELKDNTNDFLASIAYPRDNYRQSL
jgi:hypothetical protein